MENEILNFIRTNENYGALLLTGRWGCGKTFAINKIKEKLDEDEKYHMVVISLFGIDDVAILNKTIKTNILLSNTQQKKWRKLKKAIEAFEKVSNTIPVMNGWEVAIKGLKTVASIDFMDIATIENTVSVYSEKQDRIVEKKVVLVFDDFERCKIDKVDLLGIVNEFCENKKIKTIIVADEDKIGKDEEERKKYEEFKEKVISQTAYMNVQYSQIIYEIITQYKETVMEYKEFLKKNKRWLVKLFNESKSENLRILKNYILEFENVYKLWENSDMHVNVLPEIMYTIGAVYFEYKRGKYKPGKYGNLFLRDYMEKIYKSWNMLRAHTSLLEWVMEGTWDEDAIRCEWKKYYCVKEMNNEEMFLYGDFRSMNEESLLDGMNTIINKSYSGDIESGIYVTLLHRLNVLEEYNQYISFEVDYQKMIEGFRVRKENIEKGIVEEPFKRHHLFATLQGKADELYKEIVTFEQQKHQIKNRKNIVKYLNDNCTVSDVEESSFYMFDEELLNLFKKAYKKGNRERRNELEAVLLNIILNYDGYATKADLITISENLGKLKLEIEKMIEEETDGVQKIVKAEFIQSIEEVIATIENKDC